MIIFLFTLRGVAPDTRSVFSCLFYLPCRAVFIIWMSIIIFAHDTFMHAFVISIVRTVLRVLSKYSPGLLIWRDVEEGDLMDEEFDSESDA